MTSTPENSTVERPAPSAAEPTDDTLDDDLFDDGWQERPARRLGLVTRLLILLLAVAIGAVVGIALQKNHDRSLVGATGGASMSGPPGGIGGPGGSGPPTTGDAAGGTPVVAGKVTAVEDTTLLVTEGTGGPVTVKVPETATVTTTGLGGIAVGSTVSVTGTKAADGTVTATTVTGRKAA